MEFFNPAPLSFKWKGIILFALTIFILITAVFLVRYTNLLQTQLEEPLVKQITPTVVKKVDKIQKTGEFIMIEPSPSTYSNFSSTKSIKPQMNENILINGTYNLKNETITLEDVLKQPPDLFFDAPPIPPSVILIKVEMQIKEMVRYQTRVPILSREGKDVVPFRLTLPFEKDFKLKIYSQSGKTIFSKQFNL